MADDFQQFQVLCDAHVTQEEPMADDLYYAGCSFAIFNYTEIPWCRTDIKS